MRLRFVLWIVAASATGCLLLGKGAAAAPIDCSKAVAPCDACHTPDVTRPYAVCAAQRWVAPSSAKELKSPVADSSAAAKQGKGYYEINCEGCHGEKGNGAGPIAVKFSIPATDLTSKAVQNESDGELFWKITHGRGAMPNWSSMLKDEVRWQLVSFIRTFNKKD